MGSKQQQFLPLNFLSTLVIHFHAGDPAPCAAEMTESVVNHTGIMGHGH